MNNTKAKKIAALVVSRNKLKEAYALNTSARWKLQCDLDRATTALAKAVGLSLDPPLPNKK